MSRKAVWCFTVRAGVREATSQEGVTVMKGKNAIRLVLGPIEDPDESTNFKHQHGYIHCPSNLALTKGQAREVLKLANCYEEDMYLHELTTNRSKYHSYCFKSESSLNNAPERAIKRAIDSIEKDQGTKLTSKKLKTQLCKQEGPSFVARNKQVIDLVMATPEIRTNKKIIAIETDKVENMKNFMEAIARFRNIIETAVNGHGIVTSCPALDNTSREQQIDAIVCIALLPTIAQRLRVTDKIPGLWFHGRAHCGKSFLFNQLPNYKKIATDADGVSRYRLDGDQTAFLMDDVDAGWLFSSKNSKTLKALSIGETETIKTFGDTLEVRGFVVFTSNHEPDYLRPFCPSGKDVEEDKAKEQDHQFNSSAWKRRIISLFFDSPVDFDGCFIDFEMTSLDIVSRKAFEVAYEKIKDHEELGKLFARYYEHSTSLWTDEDIELYNTVFESAISDD